MSEQIDKHPATGGGRAKPVDAAKSEKKAKPVEEDSANYYIPTCAGCFSTHLKRGRRIESEVSNGQQYTWCTCDDCGKKFKLAVEEGECTDYRAKKK